MSYLASVAPYNRKPKGASWSLRNSVESLGDSDTNAGNRILGIGIASTIIEESRCIESTRVMESTNYRAQKTCNMVRDVGPPMFHVASINFGFIYGLFRL